MTDSFSQFSNSFFHISNQKNAWKSKHLKMCSHQASGSGPIYYSILSHEHPVLGRKILFTLFWATDILLMMQVPIIKNSSDRSFLTTMFDNWEFREETNPPLRATSYLVIYLSSTISIMTMDTHNMTSEKRGQPKDQNKTISIIYWKKNDCSPLVDS